MAQVASKTDRKTILFVDDEDYLAEVGREILEDYGYVVDIMTRSPAALELFKKKPFEYDALITDFTMPEMTGDRLMEKVRQIRPGLPVIICTGIVLPPDVQDRIKSAVLLMKPFDLGELVDAVQQCFAETTSRP
jgi:two-component system, cell cycle sensor histidine kinase and response regulator CckA